MTSQEFKAECDKVRKQIDKAKKTQEKAARDRLALSHKLEELEKGCTHQYGKAKLDAKTERYNRECEFCGKRQESKVIKPEFS